MNRIIRPLAWLLCLLMALAILPSALAEDASDAPALLDPASEDSDLDAALVPSADDAAPTGFIAPETDGTRRSDAVFKSVRDGEALTFTLNDSITAVLADSVLTLSGEGDTGWLNSGTAAPWYDVRDQIREVVIEDGITGITKLFWDCKNLETVTFPESLTALYGAFYGCSALKSVTLPASLTRIGEGTFAECTSLAYIDVPNVKTVEQYAFQGTAVTSYTLPATLTDFSPIAFWKGQIESYSLADGNETYLERDGVLFTDGGETLYCYPAGRKTASVRIPDGVKTVGECAYATNAYMRSIDFNEATVLNYSAFTSCSALETVTLPDTVTEIGGCVFEGCSALTSVTFGSGLKTTGYRTFASCKSLQTINFGTAITEIEGLCFAWCSSLKDVTLPKTVTKVGNGCFGECAGLESFTATALTVIPYQMFLNDYKLKSLTLNDGITEICRHAVYGTNALKHVDVPASIEFIHDYGFDPRYTTVTVNNPELDPYGRSGWRRQEYISVTGLYNYDKAFEMAALVNRERAAAGLEPLKIDAEMTDFAMQRSIELAVMYSHTRPDGSAYYSPYMGDLWAENAAEYQVSAAEVMDAWMNSEGHRKNILTASFTRIGVGCVEVEGRCYWIQWFSKGDADVIEKPDNRTVTRAVGFAKDPFEDAYQTSDVVFYFRQPPEYSYVFDTSQDAYNMLTGDTIRIRFYLRGKNVSEKGEFLNAPIPYAAQELNWSTENPNVATVDANGMLTATGDGSTKVVIQTKNGYFTHKVDVQVGSLEAATLAFAEGEVLYRGTTPYLVADGTAKTPRVTVTDAAGEPIDPAMYTVAYRDNTEAGTAAAVVTLTATGESRPIMFKLYLPPTKATSVENAPYPLIRWDPVPGAKGYVVYRRAYNLVDNGWTTFERWNNTTDTFFLDQKVYAGTRYQYGVKAYFKEREAADGTTMGGAMDNYNLGIVGPLKTLVYITQRRIKSVTPGVRSLSVRWEGSKVFTGYQVQIMEDSVSPQNIKATVKITDPKTYAYTFTGLKSNKTYYVRVRSYQVFEGMTYFGSWSDVQSCTVR